MTSYVRLYQPETPTSAFTASTYVRLGAYAPTDESSLVTGLTTTTSSDSSSSITAVSSAHSSADTSSETGNKTASVTDSQTGSYTTSNNGVLVYTDNDFQANVLGAALVKIGKGHTTEVTTGDAKYTVDQGSYTLSALNDVSITAGAGGMPANIVLTSSDYIKQTANGPLSVTTFGNTDEQTVGDSASFFLGTKFSCTIGTSMSLELTVVLSIVGGYSISVSMAACSIILVFDNSFVWGPQIQLQSGLYFKQVTGPYVNLVTGADFKTATTSTKIVTATDFKVSANDYKLVVTNGLIADYDLKVVAFPLKDAALEAKIADMMCDVGDMQADAGDFEVRTKASLLHM